VGREQEADAEPPAYGIRARAEGFAELFAGGDAELAVGVAEVVLDRAYREEEL
jgi:hypothetical protein